jgi:crotonobetaine/carnitine-CoA ligase
MTVTFPETIPDLLAWRLARATPGRPWLFFEGDSWTLADVAGEVDRCAVGLAERGVVRGDRVALLLGNRPEALFTWFAVNRLGAIASPFNHALKAPELAALLRLTRPRVLVVDDHRALAEAACLDVDEPARPEPVAPTALSVGGRGAPASSVGPDDVAVLIATSGSTGAPKAVMQTHRTFALTAEAFPDWLGLTGDDRLLAALPLFHINAQAYSTVGALGAGAGLALLGGFSASHFWEEARKLGATQVNVVGAMVHILLAGAPRASDRQHLLRICYAALALPEAEHRAFEERFGLTMTVGYGMSETTFGTVWPRTEAPRYGTMGPLRQHPRLGTINHARVVRGDGSDAADGEAGELWLSNPATMRGYWDDAAQTAATLSGPWLRTGDVVRRDGDGYFTFVARKPVGLPSALGEDEIVAYVAPRAGASIDADALRDWARARLADFKVPSRIFVRSALPHTATERVAKHRLE